MKRLILSLAATTCLPALAQAEDVKLGLLLAFTGPLETVTPDMAKSAEMAIAEVNASGMFMDGKKVEAVRGDSTCIDSGVAASAAERLVAGERVDSIVGATCSGATGAVLQNVAIPNGIMMISPSATSPGLSSVEDNGLFFRTAPSDARQGEVIAKIMKEQGVQSAAITFTNNDYGKGLSESIASAFESMGGTVTINAAHEDGKADYTAEVGAMSSAGGDVLVVAGYQDQGGAGIIRSSIDLGAFDTFVLPDGMAGEALFTSFGAELDGSYGVVPGLDGGSSEMFANMVADAGFKVGPYSAEAYDAAAVTMLAMQAAGSSKSADAKDHVMDVANAPGEKIMPGELAKALKILSEGGDIDYVGASGVELIGGGESAGNFRHFTVEDGKQTTVGYR